MNRRGQHYRAFFIKTLLEVRSILIHSSWPWFPWDGFGHRQEGEEARLLDAIKDFPLHAVLDLATPHHELQHLVDGVLGIFLFREVLDDAVL